MKPSDSARGVDLVAFAPHPDDVELFCGGTMLRAAAGGRSTAIVDLTDGELSTNGGPERRARERDAATELLGLSARRSLGLPDGSLGTDPGHRDAVVEAIRELAPRVVLAPYWEDRHPDHRAAGSIVREACFLAGIARYGAGSAHRPCRVYWYMLHHAFEPSVVVDVGPVWEQWLRLLEVYESQLSRGGGVVPTPVNHGRFRDALRARAVWFGAMVGVAYGEPFLLEGPLLLDGLPDREVVTRSAPAYQAYL